MPEQLFNVWTTDITVPGCRWHVLPMFALLKADEAAKRETDGNDVAIRRGVGVRYLALPASVRPGNGGHQPLVLAEGPSEMKR